MRFFCWTRCSYGTKIATLLHVNTTEVAASSVRVEITSDLDIIVALLELTNKFTQRSFSYWTEVTDSQYRHLSRICRSTRIPPSSGGIHCTRLHENTLSLPELAPAKSNPLDHLDLFSLER
jgi:hypothetical protein